MVEKLCATYGRRLVERDGRAHHEFPPVEALAAPAVEAQLRRLGFGYRARFVQQSAAKIVANGGADWLHGLRRATYAEAKVCSFFCLFVCLFVCLFFCKNETKLFENVFVSSATEKSVEISETKRVLEHQTYGDIVILSVPQLPLELFRLRGNGLGEKKGTARW